MFKLENIQNKLAEEVKFDLIDADNDQKSDFFKKIQVRLKSCLKLVNSLESLMMRLPATLNSPAQQLFPFQDGLFVFP